MARFASMSPLPSEAPTSLGPYPTPTYTAEGGSGYVSGDPHVALFNAAVSGLLSDQFYESADERVRRLVDLVPLCDPGWLARFVPWLRSTALLRSAPVVLAAEYAAAGFPNGRQVVDSALQRPDEPGELLAYWFAHHSRKLPYAVKRGVADACVRLYSEVAALRYDGGGKAWRLGDVIEVVHPKPKAAWQSELFKFLLDRRRHDAVAHPGVLPKVSRTMMVEALPVTERTSAKLAEVVADPDVVFSWERAAGWLGAQLDATAWTALLPSMGYFALLRNLNNLEAAQLDAATVAAINARLSDPEQVARSKVLPFRFLTAYKALDGDRFKVALSDAADASLDNLPALRGRTLIMVDCSGSMADFVGQGRSRQPLRLSELAGLMAEALASRCDHAAIVAYDNVPLCARHVDRSIGILRRCSDGFYTPRGGTSTWRSTTEAVRQLGSFDQVVIITDEQSSDHDDGSVAVPVITWNLAGYKAHHAWHGKRNRFYVAGYNDTALQTLPSMITWGATGSWPF